MDESTHDFYRCCEIRIDFLAAEAFLLAGSATRTYQNKYQGYHSISTFDLSCSALRKGVFAVGLSWPCLQCWLLLCTIGHTAKPTQPVFGWDTTKMKILKWTNVITFLNLKGHEDLLLWISWDFNLLTFGCFYSFLLV